MDKVQTRHEATPDIVRRAIATATVAVMPVGPE
jgi:hypothetical protein